MAIHNMLAKKIPAKLLSGVSLMEICEPIEFDDQSDASGEAWMAGITWQPRANQNFNMGAVDVCSPADPTNPLWACPPAITQKAFSVYDVFNASLLDHRPEFIDEKINDRFEIQLSYALAKELLSGAGSTGASLSSTAHAPSEKAFGAAAVAVKVALSIIEEELADTLKGAQGMIHMSPGLLGQAWWDNGLVRENGRFFTAMGHEVIADAGYTEAKEPTGQAASVGATEWMYGSGPVRYKIVQQEPLGDSVDAWTVHNAGTDRQRNQVIRYKFAYGIFQFDPAYVTSILVSY